MENYFDKIQDYLDGSLSENDVEAFEDELVNNKNLRDEVLHQKRLNETIRGQIQADKNIDQFKNTLTGYQKEYFKQAATPVKVFSIKKWGISIAVAASLLIALNFIGVFSTNLDQLPMLESEITRSAVNNTTVEDGINAFNAKQYKKSSELFTALLATDTTNSRVQYYLGLSYLGEEKYQDASDVLVKVANGTSLYALDGAYFTALAEWHLKNYSMAAEYAKRVSEDSEYHAKAKKLLAKISSQ